MDVLNTKKMNQLIFNLIITQEDFIVQVAQQVYLLIAKNVSIVDKN